MKQLQEFVHSPSEVGMEHRNLPPFYIDQWKPLKTSSGQRDIDRCVAQPSFPAYSHLSESQWDTGPGQPFL